MKFKFRHADKIVGLFALLAILFICFMLLMVGKNKRWFEEDIRYRTQFLTADSLSVGMGIKLLGFKIGEIKKITLTDDNLVDAEFIIYNNYLQKITPQSVLELNNSPLGGGLNLYPGILSGDPPEPYSYIPSTQFPEGQRLVDEQLVSVPEQTDIVSELMKQVPTLLRDVDKTVVTVNDLLYTVDQSLEGNPDAGPVSGILYGVEGSLAQVEGILMELNRVSGSVANLVNELENPDELIPRLTGTGGMAGAVFSDDSEVYQAVFSILDQITQSLINVTELTESLSDLSPQIALLLKETTSTLNEAEDVLEGIKNNPLLRGGVTEEEDPTEAVGADIRDSEF